MNVLEWRILLLYFRMKKELSSNRNTQQHLKVPVKKIHGMELRNTSGNWKRFKEI